jgi:protein-tyrosine phosphatase
MMLSDFHTHILPGIDDGSPDIETSLAMLREQAAQKISTVVATPHFYPKRDTPDIFLQRRSEAYAQLIPALQQDPSLPRILLGAEVAFFPGISESEALAQLTLGESDFVLIEMPYEPWTEYMLRELGDIYHKQGLTPIVAHIDRYITPLSAGRTAKRLNNLPVLIQANAEFFLTRSLKRTALKMLRIDQIHLLGSDCHNMQLRPPELGKAASLIRKHLGEAAISRIIQYENEILPDA